MSFKLNSIVFYGMCIFPIFIDSSPFDVFQRAPAVDTAEYLLADQISKMLHEGTTSDDSKIETNNTDEQFCQSILEMLANQEMERFRFIVAKVLNRISHQNRAIQRIIITTLHSCLKQNVAENDVQLFWAESRNNEKIVLTETGIVWKTALDGNASGNFDDPINLNDDISADMQPERIPNEQNSVFEHKYFARDLQDEETEDYSGIPIIGYTWVNPDTIKRKNSFANKHFEYKPTISEDKSNELDEPKQTPSNHRGRRIYSLQTAFGLGTPSNPITHLRDENFGSKIFLFDKNDELGASFMKNKEKNGKKSVFLFSDHPKF